MTFDLKTWKAIHERWPQVNRGTRLSCVLGGAKVKINIATQESGTVRLTYLFEDINKNPMAYSPLDDTIYYLHLKT